MFIINETPNVLHKIDNINTVEICIKVIAGPDRLYGRNGNSLVTHLELVSNTGKRFTSNDLRLMSLRRNELGEFEDLCRRRISLLASLVYPEVPVAKVALRLGVRFIDPETDEIRNTFFLSRSLPID